MKPTFDPIDRCTRRPRRGLSLYPVAALLLLLVSGGAACGTGIAGAIGLGDGDDGDGIGGGGGKHKISGTVVGLTAAGLVLRNNDADELEIPAGAKAFTFAARVADGAPYDVTVVAQPMPPADACGVTHGKGVAKADVTDVTVVCGPALTRAPVGPGLDNPKLAQGDFRALPLLSQTGVFTDLGALTPHPALIPFAVNAVFWSDNAIKTRWIAVPNDGPPYDAAEQVTFSAAGLWSFPAGTVTVKHFELEVDEATGAHKRLETRIGVLLPNRTFAGATYRWRADQSDADLVTSKIDDVDMVTTASGTRAWTHTYPDSSMCPTCHRASAGLLLGVRTAQLNGDFVYPSGVAENQLRAWGRAGVLGGDFAEASLPSYLRTVPITDTTASLEARARSYFEGNCSACHHPGGLNTAWDARFSTPLAEQGLIGAKVLSGDPAGSSLYRRMSYAAVDTPAEAHEMMPPLAKNHVDRYALEVVEQWIQGMP